jgi:hypothetical protein
MKRCIHLLFILLIISSCYHGHGLSPPGNIPGIRGRITFMGTWPDSTKEVTIVVMKSYPKGISDTDSLLQFVMTAIIKGELIQGEPVPENVDHYDYELYLEPDDYEWILVTWFPDIPDYLFGVKELGAYYKNPLKQELPSSVTVFPDIMTSGIDIIADFDNINREIPFF